MDKTKIAEYIALMLMELILSAENMNLRKEALTLFPELDDPQEALFDPEIRRRLVAELEKKKNLFCFMEDWKRRNCFDRNAGKTSNYSLQ